MTTQGRLRGYPVIKMERLRFALRWALGHFFVSAMVVALAACLVFLAWYPAPWRQMLGVSAIFGVVVVVDLVCGPLLTLVLSSPAKSRRERWVDLTLIALVQLSALGYGLWSVYTARPVVLAFEVDRLFVVTANEVQTELLDQAPIGLRRLPWAGVVRVGLRESTSPGEYLSSVEMSIQGVTQAMRPNWWRAYEAEVKNALRQKARPLGELMSKRPSQAGELKQAAVRAGNTVEGLYYLPLTSSKEMAWVALLDASGEIVGHAPVDGFD